MKIKIKRLHSDAKIPAYALLGDAGLDLFCLEDVTLQPGERHIFKTGIAIEFPKDYCALVWDKGGLSQKYGLKVMGGVFEHTYRGEYMICLFNTSDKLYQFTKGDKIAQLLIQPIITVEVEEAGELTETIRGENRHSSTGK